MKHGLSQTRAYNSWRKMQERVSPSFSQAKNYHDRGIGIEDSRWNSVEAFYADMGECPQGYSLERIDNDRGYCKENCKWASRSEQQKNRKYTVSLEESSLFVSLYESGRSIRDISTAQSLTGLLKVTKLSYATFNHGNRHFLPHLCK